MHIEPMMTNLHVLILQHPQEPSKLLGSARLAHEALKNSTLQIGLSWPNLSKALGRPVQSSRWGILYLGGKQPQRNSKKPNEQALPLQGIVILDGTWSQAKTLWWRNPWVLKLRRIELHPTHLSQYGKLRRQPRRECLSTIEAIAQALEELGEVPEIPQKLRAYFGEHLLRHS